MDNYFELKIKINPEISEILSEICFENLDCEGVVLAEEVYDDDLSSNLKLISTTEETLKVYLKAELFCKSRLGLLAQQQEMNNMLTATQFEIKNILEAQRQFLLNRGFTEDDLGSWEFELIKMENQDWSKKWKENWDVTPVTDKITIVPSWIEYLPKESEVIITLDPGTAFGTGTHPTTQLCMRAIEKGVNEGANIDKFADIGTGSGILAICGIKLGAKSAYGCDNDETVIETAIENARKNNVLEKCVFEHKTADQITEKFDFITANILHNVLAEIMGDLKALMNDNAKLVLSGIMDEKKQVVLDAIKANNLNLIEEMHQDVWVGLIVTLTI